MNIRKLFNIPDKEQSIIIKNQINEVFDKCNQLADVENSDQIEYKKFHDHICPNCKNRNEKTIVNKIILGNGNAKINGSFIWGFGNINGSYINEFIEINHCNECGNEWFKYKTKNIDSNRILRVLLKYLAQIIKDPKENNDDWKLEAIQIFSNCYAETIFKLKNMVVLPDEFIDVLTIKTLRKHYKSIFDETINK